MLLPWNRLSDAVSSRHYKSNMKEDFDEILYVAADWNHNWQEAKLFIG